MQKTEFDQNTIEWYYQQWVLQQSESVLLEHLLVQHRELEQYSTQTRLDYLEKKDYVTRLNKIQIIVDEFRRRII
jgi:hypothetical protein